MRKNKNKRNIFFRKSSWLLIVIFIATLITIPSFTTKAEGRTVPVEVSGIKVLCIDPGAGTGNTTLTPGTTTLANGSTAIVTTMDMAEFISKVDEVKGQYDIVVVGRKNTGLTKVFSYYNQYRDYSAPFSQEMALANPNLDTNAKVGIYFIKPSNWEDPNTYAYVYNSTINNTWPGGKMTKLENGQYYYEVPKTITNAKVIFSNGTNQYPAAQQPGISYTTGTSVIYDINSKVKYSSLKDEANLKDSGFTEKEQTMLEYYSENDITIKRSKEIQAMIENQELVYFADEIFSSDLENSNLYKVFKPYVDDSTQYPNLQHKGQNDLNLDTIIEYYNNEVNSKLKRPQITSLNVSDDDQGDTENQALKTKLGIKEAWQGIPDNRNMKFTFKVPNAVNYQASIVLDLNGDGLFDESKQTWDLSKCIDSAAGTDCYTITKYLIKDFIGYLDWKIEITNPSNGAKTYIVGNSVFKPITEKKKLTVLQISPEFSGGKPIDDTNANNKLLRLESKDKFINTTNLPELQNSGYELIIQRISYKDFNNRTDKESYLNGYDMIIVGFADNYCNNNEFNNESVKAIEGFMQNGKATMFTHDTMTLNTFGSTNANRGPKLLGQGLRDYLGQARYKDLYNTDEIDIDGSTIKHDSLLGASEYAGIDNKWSMGATLYSNKYASTMTTNVKSINKAQITSYPFKLDSTSTINVANTHTQWFQLNLEDEKVVPWYNLVPTSNNFDSGDSRNYFYTYSKGNITYSGTGHTIDGNYPDSELKLFVNTIIKASRGANSPPEIDNYTTSNNDIADGSTVSPDAVRTEDYDFICYPHDEDNSKVDVTMTANDKPIYEVNDDGTSVQNSKKTSFNKIKVRIPKEIYQDKDIKEVIIKTTAKDDFGGFAEKTFKLKISTNEAPTITNKYAEDNSVIGNGSTIVTEVPKTLDYEFTSLPEDPDDEKVKVTIKANDQNVNEVNADGTLGAIITDLEKDRNNDIRVRIPKEAYGNSSEVTVTTTVTDSKGAYDTKTFILKINHPPILSHTLVELAEERHPITNVIITEPTYFEGRTNVIYFRDHNFIGNISELFDNTATVFLTLDPNIKLKSDITIYEIDSKGVEINLGTMVRNGETSTYSYVLNSNRTLDIPDNGIQIKVKYKAEIFNLPTTEGQTYTNVLSVGDFDSPLIIRSRQSDFVPDLF